MQILVQNGELYVGISEKDLLNCVNIYPDNSLDELERLKNHWKLV